MPKSTVAVVPECARSPTNISGACIAHRRNVACERDSCVLLALHSTIMAAYIPLLIGFQSACLERGGEAANRSSLPG